MSLKGIIFDLDGTLIYSLDDLADSVNFALKQCNLKPRSTEEIKSFVGDGIKKLIERSIGENKEKFNQCYDIFISHYANNSTNKSKPYDNVIKNLKILKEKGLKLAILSNKNDNEVKKISKYFFGDIFDISLGLSLKFPKKPSCKSTLYIIEKLNLKNEEVVFIGDSEVDIKTATNAKIECLSVGWGYKTKEFLVLNNAKKIFDNFDDLTNYIYTLL